MIEQKEAVVFQHTVVCDKHGIIGETVSKHDAELLQFSHRNKHQGCSVTIEYTKGGDTT